jgi:hypothetical protein
VGLRETDTVIAIRDITSSVTGRSVKSGDRGVILKQVGWTPMTFKVRFLTGPDAAGPVVMDGVTNRDIASADSSAG